MVAGSGGCGVSHDIWLISSPHYMQPLATVQIDSGSSSARALQFFLMTRGPASMRWYRRRCDTFEQRTSTRGRRYRSFRVPWPPKERQCCSVTSYYCTLPFTSTVNQNFKQLKLPKIKSYVVIQRKSVK